MLGFWKAKNDDLASKFMLGAKVKPNYSRYDPDMKPQQMSPVMKLILEKVLIPWLFKVLTKYTYAEFHQMMSGFHHDETGKVYAGRDFVADFRKNHSMKWNWFLGYTRNHRNTLEFDVPLQHSILVKALKEHGQGWENMNYHEEKGLYQTLMRIHHLIFT